MKELKAQTIELYSKQLRTPMFNNYTDVIRHLVESLLTEAGIDIPMEF